jgi:ubiquitin-protein ligase
MIRVGRSFPVSGVHLHLLDGCFQPKIYDTRNLVYEVLGESWSYEWRLRDIIDRLGPFEEKLIKRNEQYLALQKTGQFMLGEVFIYN